MKLRRILAPVAAAMAVVTVAPAAEAVTGTLTIDRVGGVAVQNGQVPGNLSGNVEVSGQASVDGSTDPGSAPLVADAGDSAFVSSGEETTLLGAGFGGAAPYTFAWTASAGAVVEGADAATALLDTTGATGSPITATLVVTDAAGARASDTVQVVVATATTARLLDQSQVDGTPGLLSAGAPGVLSFPFTVPAGTQRIDVAASWTVAANDYDLVLVDPAGAERVVVGDPPGVTSEATSFAAPDAGTWTAQVHKFATVADTVRVVVDAVVRGVDPRPTVDSGGPYRFQIGAPQSLTATVTGGTEPVHAAWDLDGDGRYETSGMSVATSFSPGRRLVTFKATDAAGLERRETTSVLVADPARLAEDTTAVTVIGVSDTGINPYHLEFSATTYPDPDVLALTDGFTRHPSEYIPGYPADATALPVTLGQGYFPPQDQVTWSSDTIEGNRLYWIPGTKIIGAIDSDASTGASSSDDPHPILDDNGHGTGSASVSTGNRYGYCPTCLLVVVEGLDTVIGTSYSWVDITSHSFGYQYGLPVGLVVGANEETKAAAERGQTVLFAAGNGIGNAFDVPIATYGSDQTGPDWNITVGALRRDNQRGIVGDGMPVHISSWGDGNLPSACRSGTVGQCAFGGTSAATPYTAGVFGTVLTGVRDAIGDPSAGQRTVGAQRQVVAEGVAVEESETLADGLLTRGELRDAVLKTAFPLEGETSTFPFPLTAPNNSSTNVLIEGYGAATPEGARRALDVLLGRAATPDRSAEDGFFALDRQVRDTLYGGYDRDGDGVEDFNGLSGGLAALGLGGLDVADALSVLSTPQGALDALSRVVEAGAPLSAAAVAGEAERWYLHRRYAGTPGTTPGCSAGSNELYLDRTDLDGDIEPCFESRITSVLAAYRPLGIWASSQPLDQPLPAGSVVDIDLYLTTENPALVRPTGVLMATDREIGTGSGSFAAVPGSGPGPGSAMGALVATVPLPDLGGCAALGEACWTRFRWSFVTDRSAFAGEQLTFQVQLVGTRAWSFGYEGAHASSIAITPAPVPATGFAFGTTITSPAEGDVVDGRNPVVAGGVASFPDQGPDPTGAGDHPASSRVEVSIDDPDFGAPVQATYDAETREWSAPLRDLAEGPHTIYARARVGERVSEASAVTFRVRPATRVEWQVVARNAAPAADGWRDATGLAPYTFAFDTAAYGNGAHTILTRLVADGAVVAQQSVRARFGGA